MTLNEQIEKAAGVAMNELLDALIRATLTHRSTGICKEASFIGSVIAADRLAASKRDAVDMLVKHNGDFDSACAQMETDDPSFRTAEAELAARVEHIARMMELR